MFCRHCGATLADNAKFCRGCGNPVTKAKKEEPTPQPAPAPTPVEPPKPVAPPPAPPKPTKPQPTEPPKKKGKGKVIALVLSILLLLGLVFGGLVYFDVINIPNPFASDEADEQEEKEEDQGAETPQADDSVPDRNYAGQGELGQSYELPQVDIVEYFKDKATITSTTPVADTTAVPTETQAYQVLTERGFNQSAITTSYGMDGLLYTEASTVSGYSSTQHPQYETIYMTKAGEVWYIFYVNGTIYAMPLQYNLEAEIPLYVSESDTVVTYDNVSNTFYTIKPNNTFAVIKTVPTINAETLESIVLGGNS